MAGTDSRFSAANFRTNIRFAMNMGLPSATADRATFRWRDEKTFANHGAAGKPYDFSATPTSTTTHADVQIPVAVEFSGSEPGTFTPGGNINNDRAIITVLDVDYALVEGANYVLLGQNTYIVKFVAPPIGLFEVTVYQIHAEAVDES